MLTKLRLKVKLPRILDIYINDFIERKVLKSLPSKILNLKSKHLLLLEFLCQRVMYKSTKNNSNHNHNSNSNEKLNEEGMYIFILS